jgi:hypothetical protein
MDREMTGFASLSACQTAQRDLFLPPPCRFVDEVGAAAARRSAGGGCHRRQRRAAERRRPAPT